ncbi:MAG: S9 family peptidase [Bacteroidales bacterium]|nr:S9 family peptidase [Bacteroidales bacterium]
MKPSRFLTVAAIALLLAGCSSNKESNVIGKPEVTVADGRFTPEVMWQLGKMTETALSPDGTTLAYVLTYYDMPANKGNADIYLLPSDGKGDARRLTATNASEFSIVWLDDNTILFCRGTQILSVDVTSGRERVIAENERGYEGFKLSPDASKILYISTVPVNRPDHLAPLFKDLDKTTGRINEDLAYRHWDCWVDEIPHIFLADFDGRELSNITDLLNGQPYECPMRPWGGVEQFNFSPDGALIAYTCRAKTGYDYAHSTNSDIYVYDTRDASVRNISEGIMGYDQNPVFSHDGTMIAWESMERDGYESDKLRLMVLNLENNELCDLTEQFDYGVSSIAWSDDDSQLLAVVMYRGTQQIFAFDRVAHHVRQVTAGKHDINGFELRSDDIYANQVSMSYPQEIYHYSLAATNGEGQKISAVNDDVLSQVRMGRTEERWIETVDGQQMLVWLIYPYDYDSTRTYPALLFCEGGPQSMVGQFWSTRWNFQVMSGAGYFVIAPNRRGCPGFGTQWCEEISKDYGGLCMQDYMRATDAIADAMPQIDKERIGACGASFGGYSVYWLAGHNHDVKGYSDGRRFKTLLAHNGMFNFEQQYLETEEMWFENWELGGPYWDRNNPVVKNSYAQSPHLFVDKWNTPICVVHSEFDFRIVASQGMAAYNAAQMMHLKSRYLYFPDETHWVLRPQNSLLWHRNFIDWFDQTLKQ